MRVKRSTSLAVIIVVVGGGGVVSVRKKKISVCGKRDIQKCLFRPNRI